MGISGAGFPCAPLSPCQLWGAGLDCLSSGALACLSSGAGLGCWVWVSGWLGLGFWVARSGSGAGSAGSLSALKIFTDFYELALAFLSWFEVWG